MFKALFLEKDTPPFSTRIADIDGAGTVLASGLNPGLLETMVPEIGLEGVPGARAALMAGQTRGRTLVRVG